MFASNLIHKTLSNPTETALIAACGSWFAGAGVSRLLGLAWVQRMLGVALLTAKGPALMLGKAAGMPPFRFFVGPIVCLLIFIGFWFFTFMDALLGCLSPDVQKMADGLEDVMEKVGSTDRKLYIQAKKMNTLQAAAVSRMAEAVAAGPSQLGSEQMRILDQAQAIGADIQQNRAAAAPKS